MIFVQRDQGGLLIRLECDRCHIKSVIFGVSAGALRSLSRIRGLRLRVRENCRGAGWARATAVAEGEAIAVDLCPRCCREEARLR